MGFEYHSLSIYYQVKNKELKILMTMMMMTMTLTKMAVPTIQIMISSDQGLVVIHFVINLKLLLMMLHVVTTQTLQGRRPPNIRP
jgi:hypothetical protein